MCYAIQNPNSANYDYGKINIGSVIMCLLIIYSTALSVVLILKQPIEIIKDVEVEEVVKEEEVIEKKQEKAKNEEELLLANYNAKEREMALQAAYDERAKLAFEKWQEAYHKLFIIQKRGGHPDISDYLSLMSKVQEEYLETNEKLTRSDALNALKKTRLININYHTEYAHLFTS